MSSQPDSVPTPETRASEELIPIISTVLRIGVSLSILIVAAGLALYEAEGWLRPGSMPETLAAPGHHPFWHGLLAGHAFAVIGVGLFLLVLTPIARVAIGLVGYLRERDWALSATTAYVLLVLIASFFLGKA
ncbi:Predicted membrane protein [Candidatus Hydrogenisulfobacillus filiaventi]|uniref:Predicted membrane protein n=1 Tax=Candidatus Hydrogenisulfobacillus filiaventi TaxID=2707344 RepID=A0A6F8ZCK4_9FIRM|nr:Predicted membrane protein [Candidatus Hydrogenisulfobacillus filiaventi]